MPLYLPDSGGNNRNTTWGQSLKTSNVGGGLSICLSKGRLSQKTFHLTAEGPESTPSGPAWSRLGTAERQLQAPCGPMSQNSLYFNRSILWSDQVRAVRLGKQTPSSKTKRDLGRRGTSDRGGRKTLVFVTDRKTAEGRMHKAQDADPMKSACWRRLGTTPTLLQWDCLAVCVSLCGQVHMCREEVARVCVEAT